MSLSPRFASVAIDADSTLSGIEGIDWLAARRGGDVAERVASLTADAMSGEVAIEHVYSTRLEMVKPSVGEIAELGSAYVASVAPGAAEAIAALRDAGVRVIIVSGGIWQALLPLADLLGISHGDVHAVHLRFDENGGYAGFADTWLCSAGGKCHAVRFALLTGPTLAVGDGATDLEMRDAGKGGGADAFAAFTGFVNRPAVVSAADFVISSFADLVPIVLADA